MDESAWHRNLRERTEKEDGELIWHYCRWKALAGIIKEKEIWASDTRYLNDSKELKESIGLIESDLAASPHTQLSDAMKKIVSPAEDAERLPVYVASFSKAFDSLGQWRGYTGPGPSFAIGFHRQALSAIHSSIKDCAYDAESRSAAARETIAVLDEQRASVEAARSRSAWQSYHFDQQLQAYALAAQVKHESFKEECEVRLIYYVLGRPSVKFFERDSLVVPYVPIKVIAPEKDARLPIECILVGPTPHPELIVSSVKDLLLHYGSKHIAVGASSIPFRNW